MRRPVGLAMEGSNGLGKSGHPGVSQYVTEHPSPRRAGRMSSVMHWGIPSSGLMRPGTLVGGIAPRSDLQRGPVSSRASLAERGLVGGYLLTLAITSISKPRLNVCGGKPEVASHSVRRRPTSAGAPGVDRLDRHVEHHGQGHRREHGAVFQGLDVEA